MRLNCIRLLVRGVCVLLACAAFLPALAATPTSSIVPALSPFVAVGSLLATRTFHSLAWLGLGVGVIVLLRHRLFCRWVCPVGLCLDGASRLGRRWGRPALRGPQLGRWIVLLTLGGACLGYPFLLWLDPLAIFTGVFHLRVHSPGWEDYVPLAGLLALLTLSLLWPNAWCGRTCPLGVFQDQIASLSKSLRSGLSREPDALTRITSGHVLPRRALLGVAAGVVWAAVVRLNATQSPRPVRPPGALDEPRFIGTCTRCGNCLRACPSRVIERDVRHNGLGSFLTPALSFQNDYCREDCVRCTQVCPSGAIRRVALEDKAAVRMGLPRVDMNVCLLGEDRECSLCRSRCPFDAIRYVFSEADYTLVPRIDPQKCTGCGACEAACPTVPCKAIVVLAA